MKNKLLKKLGIIILSAMFVASPVVTSFTTMTVYAAEDILNGQEVLTNTDKVNTNYGTIGTNEGSIRDNFGTIGTNEGSGSVTNNYKIGTIETNKGFVEYNTEGTIKTNEGTVSENHGIIEKNEDTITKNLRTINDNYGTVLENWGTVKNNYNAIDRQGTVNSVNTGVVENQWYEVKLGNNEAEVKIKGNSIQDINGSGFVDVFAKQASAITIYSTNPNKIIDAIEGGIEYVKNADGSITISGIASVYSILTTLGDKIFEPAPTPAEEPKKTDDDNIKIDEVVIEVSLNPVLEAPVVEQTLPQAQLVVPAKNVNALTIVAANPAAATQAAMTLQNDPVVVAQAKELAVYMDAVTAAYKELAVKEFAAAPNQAVVGSAEYVTKQASIVADITNQVASLNNLTVQSLAVVQKIGVSVTSGGCTMLEAANVSLLNELLAKGVPVTLTYAVNGRPVTIKIPAGVNLTRFIDADGKLDLTKLRAYVVR